MKSALMAATSISRSTWTDDTGTPASPAEDGTVVGNTELAGDIYDPIDALFTSAFTFGDLVHAEGDGLHTFDGAGSAGGEQGIRVRNTGGNADDVGTLHIGNDTDTDSGRIDAYSSGFTETGSKKQDGISLRALRSGGLSLAAEHASGDLRGYARGTSKLFVFNGDSLELQGGLAGTQPLSGIVLRSTTSQATTGTSKETLETLTLLAGAMAVNGQAVPVEAVFSCAANANSKQAGIDFGGTEIAASQLTAVNDKAIVILSKVIRTGATSQRAYGNIGGIDTADESDYSEPAETLSGAIDIDFWATTPSSSGDCTFQFATVEFLP